MQLVELDIQNFRVIKRARLTFPDNILGLVGPNGAGKSSIIEAISWALYGNQVSRSGKEEIKSTFARPLDDCSVDLTFRVHDQTYRVIRKLAGKSERPEVELYRDNRPESIGSTGTKEYIGQLLGLDWRGFLTSFLARQQELNALSDLQPSKRREHLAGMLGIERLDKAIQKVKEDARLNQEKAAFIERRLATRDQTKTQIDSIREHVSKLSADIDLQTGARDHAKADFESAATSLREHETKKTACSQIKVQLEALARTRAHLSEQRQSLLNQLQEIEQAELETAKLKPELDRLPACKAELDQLREARSKADRAGQIRRQITELEAELKQLADQMNAATSAVEDAEKQLSTIPSDIDRLLKDAKNELETARQTYADLVAKKDSIGRDLTKLKDQVASIATIGPDTVCDRCLRPYGADLPKIKAHLESELAELQVQFDRIESNRAGREEQGRSLKQRVADHESAAKLRYELTVRQKSLATLLTDFTNRRQSTDSQLSGLRDQLTAVGETAFDPARFDRLQVELNHLESVSRQYHQLLGRLSNRESVQSGLQTADARSSEIQGEISRLESEFTALGFDQSAYERVIATHDQARQALEGASDQLTQTTKELELNKQELTLREQQLAELDKAGLELEECRSRHYYGEKLAHLFADFRKALIARIRPRLAELSSQLMDDMTGGKYSLIDLDEEYNIRILDNGHFFGIDRFSGGEKDLANLCLRLAISLALTESAGLSRSFIILDEVFGSQDENRRELILHGLANLKNRFPQIILITHISELKDRVEVPIEVIPTPAGWSEVRQNGANG